MVSRAISKSVQTGEDSVLLNIQIDRFESLKEDLGIAKAEKIVHSLVTFVGSLFNQNFDCGRLSENCFVAVLAETSDQQGLKIAEDIVARTSQEVFDVEEQTFSLTTSIGGTLLNENVPSVERALERNQQVIEELRQEQSPGNGVRFFVPNIHSDEISQNEAVVITAKKLLSDRLFSVRYQPIVALISGGSGKEYYEAILGANKDVPNDDIPEDFINNLFKSEIAAEVDRWVISKVLNTLADKLTSNPDTQLFINISRQSFSDEAFLPWLTQAMQKSKLPADVVIFQFREIDALRYLNQAAAISDEIKKAAVKLPLPILESLSIP